MPLTGTIAHLITGAKKKWLLSSEEHLHTWPTGPGRQNNQGDYLEKGIELRFALLQELLVNGLKWEFAERWQLQLFQ